MKLRGPELSAEKADNECSKIIDITAVI